MTPRERIRRYSQLVVGGAVLLWVLLCFLVAVSPRLHRLGRVSDEVVSTSTELTAMRKEIEDAKIIGGPPIGQARFDKFGILSNDEEELFLTDLIAFCKDTANTLNLVRRSDWAQPAVSTQPAAGGQQSGTSGTLGAGTQTSGTPGASGSSSSPPAPVIMRVPHSVSFSGSFLSSFYLLRKLESYRRLLTVERMDLATDRQRGYPNINGNITIELYLVKQPAVGGPAGAAPSGGKAAGAGATAAPGNAAARQPRRDRSQA